MPKSKNSNGIPVPKPTLPNVSDEFSKIVIPKYIYVAILVFLVAIVTGILGLIAGVLGSSGGR